MIEHRYRLDMVAGGRPLHLHMNQHDRNYTLILTLFAERGELTIETGTTVKLQGTRPDGESYTTSATLGENTDGEYVVTVQGDTAMTSAAGTGAFQLCFTHGGKELYSPVFFIDFETTPKKEGEAA